jgi:putative PIG3 family NAD(P)H quinone oxidoreductase
MSTMWAVTTQGSGGPEVLRWTAGQPVPVPGPDEVLVRVRGAGVNRADILQRRGLYEPPPGEPTTIGLECSGVIVALGGEAGHWAVGDEVCALLAGGGYAEFVRVPVGQLMPVPPGMDLLTAAALPEAACTVWSNLVMVAGLTAGQTVLVHGGAGGIGMMAIQVAKALGARVAVTAGTRRKLSRCAEHGADILIKYGEQDFVEEIRRATDGSGADVILDIIGAAYLRQNISAVAVEGTIVVIGLQGGTTAEINLGQLLSKRVSLVGTTLRGRPRSDKARIVNEVVSTVWPMVADGRVVPVVDQVLDIREAADAHQAMDDGSHIGKLLLRVPH